jgi:hypothetical protein
MRYLFGASFGLLSVAAILFGLVVVTPVSLFTAALTVFFLTIAMFCGGISLAFFTGDLP